MLTAILLSSALCAGTLKQSIALDLARLEEQVGSVEQQALHLRLALAYLQEQEQSQAFTHFLKALDTIAPEPTPAFAPGEQPLYEEALAYYQAQSGSDPLSVAKELAQRYSAQCAAHPEYRHLDFLLAIADANRGNYAPFFTRFYRGYPYFKESYLAYKTRGVLTLRLAHQQPLRNVRHAMELEAISLLQQALERNPKDAGLYKVLIFLAKEQGQDIALIGYLQQMLEKEAPIARGDIYLYVREAVALGELQLGQRMIDRARQLYDYSRALSAAQHYLNQHIR